MPTPSHDQDDTQPYRNAPELNHRVYVPAVWAAPGAGGGHPKLSGGFTVDRRSGLQAPRAFNRPNQTYDLPQTTIQARRLASATAEYLDSAILLGAEGRYEVRPFSGNNYDVGASLLDCDCPDWLRLDNSGYGILRCKHIHLVMLRLADPSYPDGPDWSTDRLAEYLGVSMRTAQKLCSDGFFSAFYVNGVWAVPSLDGFGTGKAYLSKLLFHPRDWTAEIAATWDDPVYDSGNQEWSQHVTLENTALFEFPETVRLYVWDISDDNTPFGEDQFTSVFEPVGSPYWTVAADGLAPGATADYTLKFHNPTGTALTFSYNVISGKGLI